MLFKAWRLFSIVYKIITTNLIQRAHHCLPAATRWYIIAMVLLCQAKISWNKGVVRISALGLPLTGGK